MKLRHKFYFCAGTLTLFSVGWSIFSSHSEKVSAIISGKYNLSRTVLLAPRLLEVTSLLKQHEGIDFRDKNNWDCNNNTHPSRAGSDGPGSDIAPLEVIFHKAAKPQQWLVSAHGNVAMGINPLDRRAYPHHPVLRSLQLNAYPVSKGFLTELNGLRVPARYDCSLFNEQDNYKPFGGPMYDYFAYVPSRWEACYQYKANLDSQLPMFVPALPVIDEEYAELVAVFQSVLRARTKFVMIELGPRWGTWGSRAVSLLRLANPMPYQLLYAEASKLHCDALRTVAKENHIDNYELLCDFATAANVPAMLAPRDHVDLIDLDIQGAECQILPKVYDLVAAKVYRLIIGTHSVNCHESMQKLFADWIVISDMPHIGGKFRCVRDNLRGHVKHWDALLKNRCYFKHPDAPFGPVVQWDGELILDNPRFVDRSKPHFSLSDKELIADDLKSK